MATGHSELLKMRNWFRGSQAYAGLKQASESAVSRWRWASGAMLPEIPFDDLVSGFPAEKWLKGRKAGGKLHGLDEQQRIRCIRSDDRTTPDSKVCESFLSHDENGFWLATYRDDAPKSLSQVKRYDISGGRLQRLQMINSDIVREYVLVWREDRLQQCIDQTWRGTSINNDGTDSASLTAGERSVLNYAYTSDGNLDSVIQTYGADGSSQREEWKYQRIPPGTTLRSLLHDAEEQLVVQIPNSIRLANVSEKVYGLFVQFSGTSADACGYIPPLYLGTERLRKRWLTSNERGDRDDLWMPAEWERAEDAIRVFAENETLSVTMRMIFQVSMTQAAYWNYRPVRQMFQRVCRRLNQLDWQGTLNPTDDFVVVPFDSHREVDATTNFRASVPADKLRLLMARGYLQKFRIR